MKNLYDGIRYRFKNETGLTCDNISKYIEWLENEKSDPFDIFQEKNRLFQENIEFREKFNELRKMFIKYNIPCGNNEDIFYALDEFLKRRIK